MIKKTILTSILLLAISAAAQAPLDTYLQRAAENNPDLRASFNRYLAALEAAPQVKALPDPQIAFGWFIQPVETRVGPQQAKISVSQMFPWFGALRAREEAAVNRAKAAYESFLRQKSALFHDVRSRYYDLYFNRGAIAVTEENLDVLNAFENLAEINVQTGSASALDLYRLEMERGDLDDQLARLRDQKSELQIEFLNLLNVEKDFELHVPVVLEQQAVPWTRAQVADSIRANNPQLAGLDYQRKALVNQEKAAKRAGGPDIALGFDYTFVGEGENNLAGTDAFVFPKIGIQVPLYRKKYRAMVKQAQLQRTATEQERFAAENSLETLLEQGWNDMQDAQRRIELYESQLDLAERSLRLLETEYRTGNQSFEDVLRMERRVLRYNLELERARADNHAAISFIKFLMGR